MIEGKIIYEIPVDLSNITILLVTAVILQRTKAFTQFH